MMMMMMMMIVLWGSRDHLEPFGYGPVMFTRVVLRPLPQRVWACSSCPAFGVDVSSATVVFRRSSTRHVVSVSLNTSAKFFSSTTFCW